MNEFKSYVLKMVGHDSLVLHFHFLNATHLYKLFHQLHVHKTTSVLANMIPFTC